MWREGAREGAREGVKLVGRERGRRGVLIFYIPRYMMTLP